MTRQRYSAKESFNRILRLFEGKAAASEQRETLIAPVLSEDEALSDLAEILADSLPNEDAELPAALVASVAEANEPDNPINTRAMTPASHQWAHEYGGIYTTTGTVTQLVLPPNTWTKFTGTFQNVMLNSGGEIVCDWNDDRIIVNEVGTYLAMFNFSILSLGDSVNLDMEVFVNGAEQPQTSSKSYYDASGTVGAIKHMTGMGFVSIISGSYAVDVRAKADVQILLTPVCAQLLIQKAVG